MRELKFQVSGMGCAACQARVQAVVEALPGVTKVSVNLLQNSLSLVLDESSETDEQRIMSAVSDAGYQASPWKTEGEKAEGTDETNAFIRQILISLLFLVPLLFFAFRQQDCLVQFLLTIPIIWLNRRYYLSGFKKLFTGYPNMDSLIAVGSSAGEIYSIVLAVRLIGSGELLGPISSVHLYFETAGMIPVLITIGKFLEARAKRHTGDAIAKLVRLTPETAVILVDGQEREVPVADLAAGDQLLIRPGAGIPVDGIVLEGESTVDQSPITGESMPVAKAAGDSVISATVNLSGALVIRAEKVGQETTLSRIIRLVEDASATKAPIARVADKVSGVFVQIVLFIAAITALVWYFCGASAGDILSFAIAVLVISCPCALGLATPVAVTVGTGRAAELGILFKSAEILEILHRVNCVVLDKTGTVTEGRPSVTDLIIADKEITESEFWRIAASLEFASEHPLAEAIRAKAGKCTLIPSSGFQSFQGEGVSAVLEGRHYFLGNCRCLANNGIDLSNEQERMSEELSNQGKTVLFLLGEGRLLGMIAIADAVKPDAGKAVSRLKSMGLKVVMLTGDNRKTADAIAANIGVSEVRSELLPQDKAGIVGELQRKYGRVAMVGDGINDAPALACADAGIAIGAGTEIAIDSANVVLCGNELNAIPEAIELSRNVMLNIRQNLFWALFYNALCIPIAAGVLYPFFGIRLNPMLAAAAMSCSSFCVVCNALRLRCFRR